MIRTCIVSDVQLYREGLTQILAGYRQIAVVGSVSYGSGDVDETARAEPDVVLLDIAGPERELAFRRFVERLPHARVLALTVAESETEIVACAEAGVSGFVTREASLHELVATVESVARGETLCSPRIAAVLLRRVQHNGRAKDSAAERLTRREREILELIRLGFSNKEIGRRLSIELSTVKNHVHNILEKLDVHQRADAVAVVGNGPSAEVALRNGSRI